MEPETPVVLGEQELPIYKIDLRCHARGVHYVLDMNESIALSLQSEWENRFGNSSAIGVGGVVETTARVLGGNVMIQELTRQIWVSSSPIELPISLLFDAENSAYDDVYRPIVNIQSLITPIDRGNGVLTPPGPRLNSLEYAVSIRVGKLYYIPDGIITSASNTFNTQLDRFGYPISGQLDLTIRTSVVYSNNDYANMIS